MQLESSGIPQRESNYLIVDGVERLNITDDLGNTNTQINEHFELEVPGVSYTSSVVDGSVSDWHSHDLVLTTQRQFSIKFRTGDDVVDIELVKGIGNASPNLAVRYNDLQLPPNVECLLAVNAQGMEDLRYDSNGDGTYDVVVPAHVRVSGAAAADVTAPQVTVTYSRVTGGGRRITINAVDTESGVQTIYYRKRETGNYQVYAGPFHIPVSIPQIVEAFADDNVSSPLRIVVPDFNPGQ